MKKRLVVGISGASGAIMGYRLLEELARHSDIETHLIVTEGAIRTFELETTISIEEVYQLADYCYSSSDLGALISSGSFETEGMIVAPCSMKTLSGIAHGFDQTLVIRVADVCLKEGRKVILVPREMPLSLAHINNMALAKQGGCVILPPMLTFYNHSDSLDLQINHLIGKMLMPFGITSSSFVPWEGEDNG